MQNILTKGDSYKKLQWFQELEDISKNYNVRLIDLALDNADNFSKKYIYNGLNNWYLKCDGHWNPNGNMMVKQKFFLKNNLNE